jgi:hypothetical protein
VYKEKTVPVEKKYMEEKKNFQRDCKTLKSSGEIFLYLNFKNRGKGT